MIVAFTAGKASFLTIPTSFPIFTLVKPLSVKAPVPTDRTPSGIETETNLLQWPNAKSSISLSPLLKVHF